MFSQTKAGHTFVAISPFTRAYRKNFGPAAAPYRAPPGKPRRSAASGLKKHAAPVLLLLSVAGNPTHAAGESQSLFPLCRPAAVPRPRLPTAPRASRRTEKCPPRRAEGRPFARVSPGKPPVFAQSPVAARFTRPGKKPDVAPVLR